MDFEIEIKFRVSDPENLVAQLLAMGVVSGAALEEVDRYLAHPSRDFSQTDEAFRLRRSGNQNLITYKGPKQGGKTKTREEIEVAYAAGEENWKRMHTVFERLGFQFVADVVKMRRSFPIEVEGRQFVVVLDQAEGLGFFAEVETIASGSEDVASAQAAVVDLADKLGLVDVEPRSYLRMTLQRDSRGS